MLRCSDGGRTGESGKEIGNYRSVPNSDGAWAAACVFHSFGRKRKMPREDFFIGVWRNLVKRCRRFERL